MSEEHRLTELDIAGDRAFLRTLPRLHLHRSLLIAEMLNALEARENKNNPLVQSIACSLQSQAFHWLHARRQQLAQSLSLKFYASDVKDSSSRVFKTTGSEQSASSYWLHQPDTEALGLEGSKLIYHALCLIKAPANTRLVLYKRTQNDVDKLHRCELEIAAGELLLLPNHLWVQISLAQASSATETTCLGIVFD